MKKNWIYLIFMLIFGLSIQSCHKKNVSGDTLTDEEIGMIVKSDVLSDDMMVELTGIVDHLNYVYRSNGENQTSNNFAHPHLPSCATISHFHLSDTLFIDITFASSGCEMPSGRKYAGTVHLKKYINRSEGGFFISGNFENFYIDEIKIEGYFTRTRKWSNDNGHPEATHEFDLTLVWPDGETTKTEGTRTIEWVEGYNTLAQRDDDVFLITGNWHVIRRDGNEYRINIITPLRREVSCEWIVSGTMEIIYNGENYKLDFGDGTCDNEAVLTQPDGSTRTVELR